MVFKNKTPLSFLEYVLFQVPLCLQETEMTLVAYKASQVLVLLLLFGADLMSAQFFSLKCRSHHLLTVPVS